MKSGCYDNLLNIRGIFGFWFKFFNFYVPVQLLANSHFFDFYDCLTKQSSQVAPAMRNEPIHLDIVTWALPYITNY